jgi:hypothetical protein
VATAISAAIPSLRKLFVSYYATAFIGTMFFWPRGSDLPPEFSHRGRNPGIVIGANHRYRVAHFFCQKVIFPGFLDGISLVLSDCLYTWLLTDLQYSVRPGFALANGAPVPTHPESHLCQSAEFGRLTQ